MCANLNDEEEELIGLVFLCVCCIVLYTQKTIEGYLDSISTLIFNTIITKLNIHAVHSSRYLQSKFMFDLSHASMVKILYIPKWVNPQY